MRRSLAEPQPYEGLATPAPWRIMRRLLALYAAAPGLLCLAALCTVLTVAADLAVPWLLKRVLDVGLAQRQVEVLYVAGGLLAAVTVLRGFTAYGQHYLAAVLAHRLAFVLRERFFAHVQRLSFAELDRLHTGDLMARATADVEAVRLFFHFGLPTACALLLTGSGTLVALYGLAPRLAWVTLASFPCFVAVALGVSRRLRPLQQQVQAHTAALTVVLQESLAGIRVVKASGREKRQARRFWRAAAALSRVYVRMAHHQALHLPLLTLLLAAAMAGILFFGGRQVIAGSLSLGTLVAGTGYLAQLAQPLRRLSWLSGMASRCQAGGARLFAVLDTVPSLRPPPQPRPLPRLRGRVCFEHVSFAYPGGEPVLRNVSFTVEPGQKVALVGPTGSGKSTLLQLIPRFYDVCSGRITLDGIDVRRVAPEALRRQIGIVEQEPVLFATTIRDNIAYGLEGVPFAAIVAAAKAAQAHAFIMALPEGYETRVGERGVTLSGGQRQRLAIARALLRDPRLLLLDDATASLDVETEALVQQALAALMAGRTTFLVTQRLRLLQQADLILVFDAGRLVQQGTHAELLRQPGLYRRLLAASWAQHEAHVLAGNG